MVAVTERSMYSWGGNCVGQLGSHTFQLHPW